MKIYLQILLGCLLALMHQSDALFLKKQKEPEVKHTEVNWPGGEWRTLKHEWKYRWVREFAEKKIVVPVWKKVWGPVEIREWVPFPRPPPGWGPVDEHKHVEEVVHHSEAFPEPFIPVEHHHEPEPNNAYLPPTEMQPPALGNPDHPHPTYGAPEEPHTTYGAPEQQPHSNYGPPEQPHSNYGPPEQQPHPTYGAPPPPPQPQPTYGAPDKQYGAPPAEPQQNYGAPEVLQNLGIAEPRHPEPTSTAAVTVEPEAAPGSGNALPK